MAFVMLHAAPPAHAFPFACYPSVTVSALAGPPCTVQEVKLQLQKKLRAAQEHAANTAERAAAYQLSNSLLRRNAALEAEVAALRAENAALKVCSFSCRVQNLQSL